MTEPREVRAEISEPAVAPDPIPKEGVHHRADAAAVNHERGELPSLGGAAGRNCCGRVHEYHLEQEQRERRCVITGALQQESLGAEQAEKLPEEVDAEFVVQARVSAHPAAPP